MARIKNFEIDGTVTESLPNTMFKVVLTDGRVLLTTLTGRMRKNFTRVLPGDKVRVEMTKYDVDRGRLVRKYQ